MTKRIGPSMSTEPGWMVAATRIPHYLGIGPASTANYASMLLSFERPAPAGSRGDTSSRRDRVARRPAGVIRLSTVLENCTEATSAAIDKRRLKTGITGPRKTEVLRKELQSRVGPDHRQDSKGAWWMPWHQESMKGVNGCDKPRLGAE
jgi:sRNA-binding carbon storage regulator CsrA